jgi:hypothetical protein
MTWAGLDKSTPSNATRPAWPRIESGINPYNRPHDRPERFIRVYMPWSRWIYTINNDDIRWMQPAIHLYWHRPFPFVKALVIRLAYQ